MSSKPQRPLVISYLALRKMVGLLGIALPVVLFLGSIVLCGCVDIQCSISNYYHTGMRNVLVGTLSAISLFLFCYRGYEIKDNIATNLAGTLCLGIALFPTSINSPLPHCNISSSGSTWIGTIHLICAGSFFLVLSYISYFLFTKSSGNPTKAKLKRNKIYKSTAIVMLLCILLIGLFFAVPAINKSYACFTPVYWLELVALWAFGLSWLTKGEFILKDDH